MRIHHDLHEALGLTLLDGTCDSCHGTFADQRRPAALADFRLSQTGASEWRVDVQRVGRDAIADPARIVVKKIGCDDFRIVEGRVRKCAFAVAIAQAQIPGALVRS